jgi:hypothetical protein
VPATVGEISTLRLLADPDVPSTHAEQSASGSCKSAGLPPHAPNASRVVMPSDRLRQLIVDFVVDLIVISALSFATLSCRVAHLSHPASL